MGRPTYTHYRGTPSLVRGQALSHVVRQADHVNLGTSLSRVPNYNRERSRGAWRFNWGLLREACLSWHSAL